MTSCFGVIRISCQKLKLRPGPCSETSQPPPGSSVNISLVNCILADTVLQSHSHIESLCHGRKNEVPSWSSTPWWVLPQVSLYRIQRDSMAQPVLTFSTYIQTFPLAPPTRSLDSNEGSIYPPSSLCGEPSAPLGTTIPLNDRCVPGSLGWRTSTSQR